MHASVSLCACMHLCICLRASVHMCSAGPEVHVAVLDWYDPEADPAAGYWQMGSGW